MRDTHALVCTVCARTHTHIHVDTHIQTRTNTQRHTHTRAHSSPSDKETHSAENSAYVLSATVEVPFLLNMLTDNLITNGKSSTWVCFLCQGNSENSSCVCFEAGGGTCALVCTSVLKQDECFG